MSSRRIVFLDLRGFTEGEHVEIVRRVAFACSDLDIREADQRHRRDIDRSQLQLLCAAVSATCALISAGIAMSNKFQDMTAPWSKDEYQELVSEIESRCGLRLDSDAKAQIENCVSSARERVTVDVRVSDHVYHLDVSKGSTIRIQGSLSTDKPPPRQ